MDFPQYVSFTITNACNLRCQMCGQWSEEGYMHQNKDSLKQQLKLADWKRLVDEIADHGVSGILIRGGEAFLYPGMIELLEYIRSKGMFTSIDSNGTLLKDVAADLLRIGNLHVTVSVDGPEEIHDQVRGVKGCFQRIREGMAVLRELEKSTGKQISTSITFTISPYSYRGLGVLPDVARSLQIKTVCIVPYYYVPEALGKEYEREMADQFGCQAFSWQGFHHEDSGVDLEIFRQQYRQFLASLGDLFNYPYLPLSEEEYLEWFSSPTSVVRTSRCANVEKLIDIQPQGNANFCVDFPDYTIGNIKESTIAELWNSERAIRFRERRREKPFGACHRCGAKYMGEPPA
jgi:MoaA/NifB/PqqE/SkfB family radical SAM enzyme